MVFFLALRNIVRNKKNSVIIAVLITVITFLFFVGNSITGRAGRSIRLTYIESLTGDVVLERSGDITMNLFGANTPVIDEFFTIPVLPAYNIVKDLVASMPGVLGITSQVSGRAALDMQGVRERALLAGVDASTYFDLFPGIVLTEGRFLQSGEAGAMITVERAQRIAERSGELPALGSPVLLTSGSDSGFRIRELPLVGIFQYQNPGQFMNEIVITDPQTVRALNSIQVASSVDIPGDSLHLLGADFDDIFGEAFANTDEDGMEAFSADMLHAFLRDNDATNDTINESNLTDASPEETGGDWNFIILRLERGKSASAFISALNRQLAPFDVMAVNWRVAAGTSALLTLLIQALYNAGLFLVSIAGVITVINILLIAVFRRTKEIGTLRAIGASDSYIRSLILSENLVIALFSGFFGITLSLLFFHWLNGLNLRISNDLIASVLGGSFLIIDFSLPLALASLATALGLALLASAYPVEAAVRIPPMAAVRQG